MQFVLHFVLVLLLGGGEGWRGGGAGVLVVGVFFQLFTCLRTSNLQIYFIDENVACTGLNAVMSNPAMVQMAGTMAQSMAASMYPRTVAAATAAATMAASASAAPSAEAAPQTEGTGGLYPNLSGDRAAAGQQQRSGQQPPPPEQQQQPAGQADPMAGLGSLMSGLFAGMAQSMSAGNSDGGANGAPSMQPGQSQMQPERQGQQQQVDPLAGLFGAASAMADSLGPEGINQVFSMGAAMAGAMAGAGDTLQSQRAGAAADDDGIPRFEDVTND